MSGTKPGTSRVMQRAEIAHRVPDVGGPKRRWMMSLWMEAMVEVPFEECCQLKPSLRRDASRNAQSDDESHECELALRHRRRMDCIVAIGSVYGEQLRAHRLDIVAVGVDQERGVIGRAVIVARARAAIVAAAGLRSPRRGIS